MTRLLTDFVFRVARRHKPESITERPRSLPREMTERRHGANAPRLQLDEKYVLPHE